MVERARGLMYLARLQAAFPGRDIPDSTIELYLTYLDDFEEVVVDGATRELAETLERPPVLAQLLGALTRHRRDLDSRRRMEERSRKVMVEGGVTLQEFLETEHGLHVRLPVSRRQDHLSLVGGVGRPGEWEGGDHGKGKGQETPPSQSDPERTIPDE